MGVLEEVMWGLGLLEGIVPGWVADRGLEGWDDVPWKKAIVTATPATNAAAEALSPPIGRGC